MIRHYTITLIVAIGYTVSLLGQREMVITEMNSDNDAVVEIAGEDPDASDYTLMTLGFNQSNEAWMRTRTNHDLSFFTNDSKRLILTKEGDFELRTHPLGLDGTQITSLDFFTGSSNYRGGITYCDCPADGGDLMSFNMSGDGYYNFRSNGETRMFLGRDGEVRFGGLAGAGIRPLSVDEDGELTTEASPVYINIGASQFQQTALSDDNGDLRYNSSYLAADFFFGSDGPVDGIANPIIPFAKYKITEIQITYIDNSNDHDLSIYFYDDTANPKFHQFMSVNQPSEFTQTVTLNQEIDNQMLDGLRILASFNDEVGLFLYNIKIKVTPLY